MRGKKNKKIRQMKRKKTKTNKNECKKKVKLREVKKM